MGGPGAVKCTAKDNRSARKGYPPEMHSRIADEADLKELSLLILAVSGSA